jgi:hypothetical protein
MPNISIFSICFGDEGIFLLFLRARSGTRLPYILPDLVVGTTAQAAEEK